MLDPSTFEYLKPTDVQLECMAQVRAAFATLTNVVEQHLVHGPDKTDVIRQIRTAAMWANVAITRHADGGPRK